MLTKRLLSALLAAALCTGTLPAALAANTAAPAASQTVAADRREDLAFLLETLEKQHPNLYANTDEAVFAAKRAAIEAELGDMSDVEFAIALSELAALVGDSHTGINVNLLMDQLAYLPVALTKMRKGWVIDTLPREQAAYLGSTLTAVNGVSTEQAIDRISPMIAADNEAYRLYQAGSLLTIYDVLHQYGIADDPERVTLTVRTPDGQTQELSLSASSAEALRQTQVARLSEQRTGVPATEADRSQIYFSKAVDSRTLYIQYNSCREDENLPMETFAEQVKSDIEQKGYDRVVIDLRNNGGGSDGVLIPLLWMLAEKHEQDGLTLYTLTGDRTFSSAIIGAVELKDAGSVMVGTPTGGSVDHFGSVSGFNLPHSGVRVSCSTKFIDMGELVPAAKPYGVESLPPDIAAEQTLSDYLAGRDTAVEAILARGNDTVTPKSELTRAALAVALGRDYAARTKAEIPLAFSEFADVPVPHYASPFIAWAAENGVMSGTGDHSFAPGRTVTRQELAAVLSRYAALCGKPIEKGGCEPSDSAAIAPWAQEAARDLADAGLLPLRDGAFTPQAPVARAELVELLAGLS